MKRDDVVKDGNERLSTESEKQERKGEEDKNENMIRKG